MGVYIKGMEMPRGRGEYELRLYIDSDGTCTVEGSYCCFEGEPFDAVPVPPHGDLIDQDAYRDEFMNGVYALCSDDPDNYRANAIIDLFDNAPSIIPAEELKEE